MNWRATNEKQQEALWRVFLMLVIRTGLVSRGMVATVVLKAEPEDAALGADQLFSASPADRRQVTLVLLCMAEAVGRLFILDAREAWELMNQPLPQPRREHPANAVGLCGRSAQRLDTS
jgi:hypothetical protein